MTESRRYLVAYDISCPRRWRRAVSALKKVCGRVQLSVFLCRASPTRMRRLEDELRRILHHRDDRLMILDVGTPGVGGRDGPLRTLNPMSAAVELGTLVI